MKKSPKHIFGLLTLLLFVTSLSCGLLQGAAKDTPIPPGDQSGLPPAPTQQPASPSAVPQPSATSAPQPNAYFDGISFIYDPSLTKGVRAQVIEASAPADPNSPMPFFGVHAKTYQFDFQGYPISQNLKPQILVFSVSEYEKLISDPIVTGQVDGLKKLLADHPADSSGELPSLPLANAGQIMHAQLKYIKFQNGSGIRYLAEMGQNYAPLSNKLLFYTFQGFTSDGVYYVSAVLPVNHAQLPGDDGEALSVQDFGKFSENFPNYVVDIQNKLNAEQGSSFTPSLDMLDAMISSIKVDK
jgi:hypothetical protein